MATTPATSSLSSSTGLSIRDLVMLISVKLNETNFLIWKKQLLPILKSYVLFSYVDYVVEPPPAKITNPTTNIPEPNPFFLEWKKQDLWLIGVLQATLSESLIADTIVFSLARDLYEYIESTFSAQVTARNHHLHIQLQTVQKLNSSITEYLNKLKTISDALATITSPVSDAELVAHTLRGFGADYESFVTAIETHEKLPILLNFFLFY
ncbi:hypothetical protein MKX01_040927 [Papaver californicum]|nr:hypothetical protein MKX01_040927 [Papaver californicum]